MKNVIIASLNPAKIQAVESAFSSVFPQHEFNFKGVSVPSNVSDQPMSNCETYLGSTNRVYNAQQVEPSADYYVGIEAGIEGHTTFAWMIIESRSGQRGESRSASLMLPPVVIKKLEEANELGDVMDEVFKTHNIKQKGGAIGLLTQNQLTRSSVYHQALILALIPFSNPEHY